MRAECRKRAGEGHLVRRNEIAPAQLDGIDRKPRGDRIHHAFAHEGAFEAPRRAIGAAGGLVGQPQTADRAIRGHAVRAGQHGGGKIRHRRRVRAHITALVVEELIVDGEDTTLGIGCGANLVPLRTRMIGRDQVLAPVLDPLHRPAQAERAEADQHILGIELAANPEAAADMAFIKMHGRRIAAEHPRDGVPVPVRHLRGAVELQHVAAAVVARNRPARLQRHTGVTAHGKIELDHGMRVPECCGEVAV